MIENIKVLYKQISKKTDFTIYAASYFNLKPTSLRNHWFSNFWQIPETKQEEVVTLLKNWTKKQNK